MADDTDIDTTPPAPAAQPPVRLPRRRWWAALCVAMLALGAAVGAAIGPAPTASLAGDVPGLAQELPLLITRLEAAHKASTATTPAKAATPAVTAEATPVAPLETAKPPASQSAPAAAAEEPSETPAASEKTTAKKKLPAITNVWLIELSGGSFETATGAQKAAAPFINSTLLAQSTLLASWSAPQASAFAGEAVLAEPPLAGAPPPLLHSIVQPPCPEMSLTLCGPEKPGQLTAADEFLKATLATITGSSTYKEHGLIVVTFATVGIASQSELPPGASTATLTYQPPAGVALLSPFAKAGRSSVTFNTTSPRQNLEELLR
ncbi:MAG TPA: hypothetical protein VGD00_03035 [Solirubrobacteraceae bacterium]